MVQEYYTNKMLLCETVIKAVRSWRKSFPNNYSAVEIIVYAFLAGSVRLIRSWTEDSGFLEVLSDGYWSVVADENLSEEEGNVACRELGYEALAAVRPPTTLCPVQAGASVIESLNCSGTEQQISQCTLSPAASASKSTVVAPSGISCAG